jgi:hypothetical protein
MLQVRFELIIPVFEWVKTIYALGGAATVIGNSKTSRNKLGMVTH